jgi:hypothetical protein
LQFKEACHCADGGRKEAKHEENNVFYGENRN